MLELRKAQNVDLRTSSSTNDLLSLGFHGLLQMTLSYNTAVILNVLAMDVRVGRTRYI